MTNPYGITLDDASRRWAVAEGVPESVIAAICLLDERSIDEIVAKLSPVELEQVIKIGGRSRRGYPPGVHAALKDKRDLPPSPRADGAPRKAAPKGQSIPHNVAAQKRDRPSQRPAALRQRAANESRASPAMRRASLRMSNSAMLAIPVSRSACIEGARDTR
jgi:hypothetical protein